MAEAKTQAEAATKNSAHTEALMEKLMAVSK